MFNNSFLKKFLLCHAIFLLFFSQVDAKILLLASDRANRTDGGVNHAKEALIETGMFNRSEIDTSLCRHADPSLNFLKQYSVVLVWSNYRFYNPENVGNILKQYVDSGGKLVMAVGCYSHRNDKYWQIEGAILNAGYSPFLSNTIQSVSGSLYLNSITQKDHPIFSQVTQTPTYWSNHNFSNPPLNNGGNLLATDTDGNNLIAQNSEGTIIAMNIYPGYLMKSEYNSETKRLFANAILSVSSDTPKMEISPANANISAANGMITINVFNSNDKGTMNWTALSNRSWAAIQTPNGVNDGVISIACSDNPGNARSANITISANKTFNSPQVFTLYQCANTSPTISTISNVSIIEDSSTDPINFIINDSETPEQLTVSARSLNRSLVPNHLIRISGTGTNRTVIISPASNQNGTATIKLTVSDGYLSSTTTFNVSVIPVNDPPSFVKGGNQTFSEDAGDVFVNEWALSIKKGPENESDQSIIFHITTNNDPLFSVLPMIDSNGALSCQLAPDAYGTAQVSVYVKDNGGTANQGNDTSDAQVFTINVIAVNDAPSFTKGPNQIVWEDAARQNIPWATDISAGPNESHQALTFYLQTDQPELFSELPAISSDGILTYTPSPDVFGEAVVEVYLKDDASRKRINGDTSPTQRFTIQILPVNDPPSFSVTDISILEDAGFQSFTNHIFDIITGPENESDQYITFDVETNDDSFFKSLPEISPEGGLTFETSPDANGPVELYIVAKDNGKTERNGNDTSDTIILNISVIPVNDPPSFTKGKSQYHDEDVIPQQVNSWARNISTGPLNERDQDVLFVVTTDVPELFSEQPTISPDGRLNYSVMPETSGIAYISVKLTDNGGTENGGIANSSTQKFKIVVRDVNDPPTFTRGPDQEIEKSETASEGYFIKNWADNISPGPNEDYQLVKFHVVTDNENLFVQPPIISPAGTLMFTPAAHVNGRAKCSVTIEDDSSAASDRISEGTYISLPQDFFITIGDYSQFSLHVNSSGCAGHVLISANGIEYTSPFYQDLDYGSMINLHAVPSESCTFVSWSNSCHTNPCAFPLTDNSSITAHFKEKALKTLIVENNGNGKIRVDDDVCDDSPCTYSILENSLVHLEAIPNDYLTAFDSWSGIDKPSVSEFDIRLHNDQHITGNFIKPVGVWDSTFSVTGSDYGAIHHDEVTIGVGVTTASELSSPTDLFSCSIDIVGAESNEQLAIYEYGQNSFQWTIAVNPHGNVGPPNDTTVSLRWDPALFSNSGAYQLRAGIGSFGEILIANMQMTDELTITGNNSLQYFTITCTESFTFEYHLNSGWNLISIPVVPDDNRLSSLFVDASAAYGFKGGSYYSVNSLEPWMGYWVKVPEDNVYTIRGFRVSGCTKTFSQGWHIIGLPPDTSVDLPDDAVSAIYQYVDQQYRIAESFEPGIGYWIKVMNEFVLTTE